MNLKKRKLLTILICGFATLMCMPCYTSAENYKYWYGETWPASWVKVPWTEDNQKNALMKSIQKAINRVLGILSLIALVLCLYAWFKIMTSWGDSKQYSAWWSILKNAAIWLAIIWLSRLIVSLIFRLINGAANSTLNEWW